MPRVSLRGGGMQWPAAGKGVSLLTASPCPRGRWYPPGYGTSGYFGGTGMLRGSSRRLGRSRSAALLSRCARWRSMKIKWISPVKFSYGEAPLKAHTHAPKLPSFLLDSRKKRWWEEGAGSSAVPRAFASPALSDPALRAEPPRRHRPPRPKLQPRRLDGRNQSEGRGGKHRGQGAGGQRGPRGVAPGLGRAPVPRRGAGFGVRVPPPAGRGGAGGGSEGAPPPARRLFPRIKPAWKQQKSPGRGGGRQQELDF